MLHATAYSQQCINRLKISINFRIKKFSVFANNSKKQLHYDIANNVNHLPKLNKSVRVIRHYHTVNLKVEIASYWKISKTGSERKGARLQDQYKNLQQ